MSHDVVAVVFGIPPFKFQTKQRMAIYYGIKREESVNALLYRWQSEWDTAPNRWWTYRLKRGFSDVSYYINQFLMGHDV